MNISIHIKDPTANSIVWKSKGIENCVIIIGVGDKNQVIEANVVNIVDITIQKEDKTDGFADFAVQEASNDNLRPSNHFDCGKAYKEHFVVDTDEDLPNEVPHELSDGKKLLRVDEIMNSVKCALKEVESEKEKKLLEYEEEIKWLTESKGKTQMRLQEWINIKDEVMHWKRKHDDVERKMKKMHHEKMAGKDEEIRFLKDDNLRLAEKSKTKGNKKELKKLKDENEKLKDENANLNLKVVEKDKMVKFLYGQVIRVEEVVNGYKTAYDEMKTTLILENEGLKKKVKSLKILLKKDRNVVAHNHVVKHEGFKRHGNRHEIKKDDDNTSVQKKKPIKRTEKNCHSNGERHHVIPATTWELDTTKMRDKNMTCKMSRKIKLQILMSNDELDCTFNDEMMPGDSVDKQLTTETEKHSDKSIVDPSLNENQQPAYNRQENPDILDDNDDEKDLEGALDFFLT